MSRKQRWECVPCRRTVTVLLHTCEAEPTERECACGRPMGLVLFADSLERTRCSPRPSGKAVRA